LTWSATVRVGVAGGPDRCRHVVDDLGFDACVDHKDPAWREQFDAATPDGVDLDFDRLFSGATTGKLVVHLADRSTGALAG
jgi:NADPH:quinone reductase-like Zn-dependent oxidoreductase